MKPIRYILNKDVRVLCTDETLKTTIELPYSKDLIFVNILFISEDKSKCKLRLFYSNGDVIEGWNLFYCNKPISLYNEEELFDGRFNQ